jgi:hypothetical protein
MSSRATVLRDSRHREFLESQRRDPVTHEVFTAGDRVTRCARCLLPFLQESWEAIGRTHCGQLDGIGLDDVEPIAADEKQEDPRAEATPFELALITIQLDEVPLTLR